MKIYIAAPLPYIEEAKACRAVVRSFGHEVVSSWMDLACASPEAEAKLSEEDRVDLGITCLMDVSSADVVLWLYGKKSTRSGAVAEAGFAIGKGKMVLAVPLYGYSRDDFPTVVLEGWVVHEATPVDALRKLDDELKARGVGPEDNPFVHPRLAMEKAG